MKVPAQVLRDVESTLAGPNGVPPGFASATPVGGGCINPSAKLELERGRSVFLKWNTSMSPEMFAAEADGLKALASPGFLRVPEVLGHGGWGTLENPSWLLLEFLPKGKAGPDYGQHLGEGLALLHNSADRGPEDPEAFGWQRDNFIGSLPQANDPADNWGQFWRDSRLEPQIRMARERGYFSGTSSHVLDDLLGRTEEILASSNTGGPALLHGDLWSGNYYPDPTGEPVIIDPAVYRGSGEVDLAMMELFGALPRGFREGYEGVRELAPEYEAFRRDLYQLYYLLVHVNLFGSGYEPGSVAAARRVLLEV